jgi:hypothetical protein
VVEPKKSARADVLEPVSQLLKAHPLPAPEIKVQIWGNRESVQQKSRMVAVKRLDMPRNGQRIGTSRYRSSFKLV